MRSVGVLGPRAHTSYGGSLWADTERDLFDGLAKKFARTVPKSASDVYITGGSREEREYFAERIEREIAYLGKKVHEGERPLNSNGYLLDITWYVDIIKEKGKVPEIGASLSAS